MNCRICGNHLTYQMVDLINSPPANSFLTIEQLNETEIYYPLLLYVCDGCFLVQVDEYKKNIEIFNKDYVYLSSYSKTWLEHCKQFVKLIVPRINLNKNSFVVEVASNDGYLLQYFQELNIPVMGIEPTLSTAKIALSKGINTIIGFFNSSLASNLLVANGMKPDLIIGNNVLPHVPDINDFIDGFKIYLSPDGIITMEFPHIIKMIEQTLFDTIYHEHFSYFSLFKLSILFSRHDLEIFDVEELPTHGGSLRIYVKHKENDSLPIKTSVKTLLAKELSFGVNYLDYYSCFKKNIESIKYKLLDFLIRQKKEGKTVVAYGAAAKGNTLLNYCGIKGDLISFVVDASPHKQGKFLPGSHIPVVKEKEICILKPDFILILPWNIKEEIMEQLKYVREWGCKFVIALSDLIIY